MKNERYFEVMMTIINEIGVSAKTYEAKITFGAGSNFQEIGSFVNDVCKMVQKAKREYKTKQLWISVYRTITDFEGRFQEDTWLCRDTDIDEVGCVFYPQYMNEFQDKDIFLSGSKSKFFEEFDV